jgi:hypothetical protein
MSSMITTTFSSRSLPLAKSHTWSRLGSLLIGAAALAIAAGPLTCLAQATGENLLVALPSGYKVAGETKQGDKIMTLMIPEAQSIEQWQELVTTLVFLGAKDADIAQFSANMQSQWLGTCKGGAVAPVRNGKENGMAFVIWVQVCPHDRAAEYTYVKALAGRDGVYVVQKAAKFPPTKQYAARWMQYLRGVSVCDTRLPNRPCPKVNPDA